MSEPDFIYQTVEEFPDVDTRLKWFDDRALDAKEQGCRWARFSIHEKHGWCLFEGWKAKPDDEGEIRSRTA